VTPPAPNLARSRAAGNAGLGRLADLVVRWRWVVLVCWIAVLAAVVGFSSQLAGDWEVDYNTPGSGSERAAALMAERFGDPASGDTVTVVWEAPDGFEGGQALGTIERYLAEAAGLEGITGQSEIEVSDDGTIGMTSLRLDRRDWDVPVETGEALIERAELLSGSSVRIELAGGVIQQAREAVDPEVVGMGAALIILLIAFGSLVAAGLPLLTAIFGLGITASLIGVLAQPLVALWLASLIERVPRWVPLAALAGLLARSPVVLLLPSPPLPLVLAAVTVYVLTSLAAAAGSVFTGRIHVENVSDIELGGLLAALNPALFFAVVARVMRQSSTGEKADRDAAPFEHPGGDAPDAPSMAAPATGSTRSPSASC
jgi:hypothetical protein